MKCNFFLRSVIALIFTLLLSNTYSQTIEKKTYQTAFAKAAPEIDGMMNDSCWSQVEWKGNFIQTQPYENKYFIPDFINYGRSSKGDNVLITQK